MAQHTPGPWIYDSGAVYAENGQGRIALADRDNPRTKPVERDANARLIAAAPEMLELIRGYRQFIYDFDHYDLEDMREGMPQVLADLDALLAKVEGNG